MELFLVFSLVPILIYIGSHFVQKWNELAVFPVVRNLNLREFSSEKHFLKSTLQITLASAASLTSFEQYRLIQSIKTSFRMQVFSQVLNLLPNLLVVVLLATIGLNQYAPLFLVVSALILFFAKEQSWAKLFFLGAMLLTLIPLWLKMSSVFLMAVERFPVLYTLSSQGLLQLLVAFLLAFGVTFVFRLPLFFVLLSYFFLMSGLASAEMAFALSIGEALALIWILKSKWEPTFYKIRLVISSVVAFLCVVGAPLMDRIATDILGDSFSIELRLTKWVLLMAFTVLLDFGLSSLALHFKFLKIGREPSALLLKEFPRFTKHL